MSAARSNELDHFRTSNLLICLGADDTGADPRAFAEWGNKGLPSCIGDLEVRW